MCGVVCVLRPACWCRCRAVCRVPCAGMVACHPPRPTRPTRPTHTPPLSLMCAIARHWAAPSACTLTIRRTAFLVPSLLSLPSSFSLSQLVSCHDLFHDSHSPSSSSRPTLPFPQPQLPVSHNLPLKHLPPKPVPRHLLPSLFESHASAYDPTTDRPRPGIPGMRTTSLSSPTVLSSPVHHPRAGPDCGQATITQQTRTHSFTNAADNARAPALPISHRRALNILVRLCFFLVHPCPSLPPTHTSPHISPASVIVAHSPSASSSPVSHDLPNDLPPSHHSSLIGLPSPHIVDRQLLQVSHMFQVSSQSSMVSR